MFFSNDKCKYFVCHGEIDKEKFSCIFCFCPLYPYQDCLGTPFYKNGMKDCSKCIYPHLEKNYQNIIEFIFRKIQQSKKGVKNG